MYVHFDIEISDTEIVAKCLEIENLTVLGVTLHDLMSNLEEKTHDFISKNKCNIKLKKIENINGTWKVKISQDFVKYLKKAA